MRKVVAISGCSTVVMWNGFTAGEVHGDPAAGRAIFFDAGQTENCRFRHTLGDRGGHVGPDLRKVATMPSDYASRYSLKQLLDLVAFVKSMDPTSRAGVTLKDLF